MPGYDPFDPLQPIWIRGDRFHFEGDLMASCADAAKSIVTEAKRLAYEQCRPEALRA